MLRNMKFLRQEVICKLQVLRYMFYGGSVCRYTYIYNVSTSVMVHGISESIRRYTYTYSVSTH